MALGSRPGGQAPGRMDGGAVLAWLAVASLAPPTGLPSCSREGVKLQASLRECGAINTHSPPPPTDRLSRHWSKGAGAQEPSSLQTQLWGRNFSWGRRGHGASPAWPSPTFHFGSQPALLEAARATRPSRGEQTFLGKPPLCLPGGQGGADCWSNTWTEGQVSCGPVLPVTPLKDSSTECSRGAEGSTRDREGTSVHLPAASES